MSWSDDRTLSLWDLASSRRQHLLDEGCWGSVYPRSKKGRRAPSWWSDRTLRLLDLDRKTIAATYFGDGTFCPPAIDESAARIVTGDGMGRMHFLRLSKS